MSVQMSALIGANREFLLLDDGTGLIKISSPVYQASDKPRYYKANKAIVGIICFNLVCH